MSKKPEPLVYILDDDRGFCLLLSNALKRFGMTCEAFDKTADFRSRLDQQRPSLCILDLNVEGVNSSVTLIREVRAQFPPTLPIIVVSSDNTPAAISEAIESGANDYLTKPLEREVLVSKLMRYIESQELESAAASFMNASDGRFKVAAEIDVDLVEIDELGVRIASRTLVSKGMAISVGGSAFSKATGSETPVLLTVVSSELNAQSGRYEMYLEFDSSNQALLGQVRTWLAQSESKA